MGRSLSRDHFELLLNLEFSMEQTLWLWESRLGKDCVGRLCSGKSNQKQAFTKCELTTVYSKALGFVGKVISAKK